MIGIDSLSSACPMGPTRMRLRPSPSVLVCRTRLRSAVGQKHELAKSAAGKADVERLAPVFEDEGRSEGDRDAPIGSRSVEHTTELQSLKHTSNSIFCLHTTTTALSTKH